jgi:hypothetical protein
MYLFMFQFFGYIANEKRVVQSCDSCLRFAGAVPMGRARASTAGTGLTATSRRPASVLRTETAGPIASATV